MKASLSLMRSLSSGNQFHADASEVIERIGAQIGAIEDTINLADIYKDALVVKVISSTPIPNSNHLSLCMIDDMKVNKDVERNSEGLVQVVCGAPNVKSGQIVVWLPPGSVVPSSQGSPEPFTLTSRKIMDNISNGMLASASELAISNDHNGIVVFPDDTKYGTKFADALDLNDIVIDIENKMFTHRPDLFGQLGIAREVYAVFNQPFKSPDWYRADNYLKSGVSGGLSVDNQLVNNACPRFMAVAIGNIKVKESPLWLQSYLSRSGVRPVNNIVDVTNYVMIVSGQPLHAYDLNKVKTGDKVELVVRDSLENEKLVLLDGSEIKLSPKDIVIANRDGVIGLGGVMGGQYSEVSSDTSAIVLECASFDMYRIRHSSMAHGIFSEAVTRFNKGQSPLQNPAVMSFAYDLLKQVCPEAELISEVVDSKSDSLAEFNSSISLDLTLLSSYLGLQLDPNEAMRLLNNAEIESKLDGHSITVKPPFWRTDLIEPVDVIEEIARLIGFDRLPRTLPSRLVEPPEVNHLLKLKTAIRHTLASSGANEVFSYSFIDQMLLSSAGQDSSQSFSLSNALSPELSYYRQSIVPSLLSKVHLNHKAGYDQFCLFEIGKTHLVGVNGEDELPLEAEHLGLVVSAMDKTAKSYKGEPYYFARTYLDYLIKALAPGLEDKIEFLPINDMNTLPTNDALWIAAAKTYRTGRSAVISINNTPSGVIGEFNTYVSSKLKLPAFSAGFELDAGVLLDFTGQSDSKYIELSRFPKVVADLTLSAQNKTYSIVLQNLTKNLIEHVPKDVSFAILPIDAYKSDKDSSDTNWTFRLRFESKVRTLTDKEISDVLAKLN